jgi:putative membrane protein
VAAWEYGWSGARHGLDDARERATSEKAASAGMQDMTKLLIRLAVAAGAVLLVQWAFRQWGFISVDSWVTAVIFAVVLGLFNALVRPILLLVTCPLTLLTLGLFTFVVNAMVFWLAAQLVTGFAVGGPLNGFGGAFVGSLAVTICTAIADRFLEE